MIEFPSRKVLMSPELMREWATRDLGGNLLRWEWGEPDEDGFYTPTITVDYSDNREERLVVALNGFKWLANNLHNSATETWRELFMAAIEDADKAIAS